MFNLPIFKEKSNCLLSELQTNCISKFSSTINLFLSQSELVNRINWPICLSQMLCKVKTQNFKAFIRFSLFLEKVPNWNINIIFHWFVLFQNSVTTWMSFSTNFLYQWETQNFYHIFKNSISSFIWTKSCFLWVLFLFACLLVFLLN